jgi:hypothetical protein
VKPIRRVLVRLVLPAALPLLVLFAPTASAGPTAQQWLSTTNVLTAPAAKFAAAGAAAGQASSFTFGLTKELSPQILGGFNLEPEIKTDLYGNVYLTAMEGVPGGVDLWKSTDKGANFTYLGQPDGAQCPGGGNPVPCTNGVGLGGGDDSIDVSSGGYLYVSSLWLGNVTISTSKDGGVDGVGEGDWQVNPLTATAPVDDRQWIAAYGPQTLYNSYTQIGSDTIFVSKATNMGTTVPTGSTFGPPVPVFDPVSSGFKNERQGNLVVDQYNGNVYTAFQPQATGGHSHRQVYVVRSTDGGATWSAPVLAYQGPPNSDTGHSFPILALDRGGNLHLVLAQCIVNPGNQSRSACHVYLTSSTDAAASWSTPVQVDNLPDSATSVFPWAVAGSSGIVDITWYGTSATTPDVASNWYLFFAQTRNALSGSPTFDEGKAVPDVVHDEEICFRGLDCDINGGNRDLAEYYTMTLDPEGNANIAYSRSNSPTNSGCLITCTWYTKQVAGPSAYVAPAGPPPATFAASYMPDPAHTGGEPNIWIDSDNCIYLAAINSNAPGGLPVYKSTNGGASFTGPKPVSGPIVVGDADIVTFDDGNSSANDDVYLSSLQVADVAIMKSADGESFALAPGAAGFSNFSSDRMWFAADKLGTDQVLYQNDHELVSEDIRVFKSVNDGPWTGTTAITDAELLARTTPNTNTGNIWVERANHNVYTVFPASSNQENALEPPFGNLLEVWIAVSTGNTAAATAGTVWSDYPVFKGLVDSATVPTAPPAARTYGTNAGNIFAVGDVDSAGNLYVAWGMNNARTNRFDIWFASSRDKGKSWYGPFQISQGLGTSVMPWLAAGDNGRVTIAWYGTSAVGDPNTLPTSAQWNLYFAQSTSANDREPAFTQVQAGDHVLHVGSIRTGGLIGSGDRRLLDFFEIALNRQGMTHIIYADTGLTTGTVPAKLSYTRQTGGPSAYVSPTSPLCPGGPTAASLRSIGAKRAAGRAIRVSWETSAEAAIVGFNVWRSAAAKGRYTKLNPRTIPARAAGRLIGRHYSYVDGNALRGTSFYRLQLVRKDGSRVWAGPAVFVL